tara:strand:+ start:3702 stop:3986 length:285 start_codon:yes stop_codon:yes gene_type:complete
MGKKKEMGDTFKVGETEFNFVIPTFKERCTLNNKLYKIALDNTKGDFTTYSDIVLLGTNMNEDALNDLTNEDIIELGRVVIEKMNAKKKKLSFA